MKPDFKFRVYVPLLYYKMMHVYARSEREALAKVENGKGDYVKTRLYKELSEDELERHAERIDDAEV